MFGGNEPSRNGQGNFSRASDVLVLPGRGGLSLADRRKLLLERLSASSRSALTTEVDERRTFLWLPVCFGIGVILYFSAGREPSLGAAAWSCAVLTIGAVIARQRAGLLAASLILGLACVAAGFLAGTLRTWSVAAPVLPRMMSAKVTAFVETVDDYRSGKRLLLRVHSIDGLKPQETPQRIRVTLRAGRDSVEPGQSIAARMRILPPPRPSEPGGYDFSRAAYFQKIGAVGSISSKIESVTEPFAVPLASRVNAAVDRARNALTYRIVGVIGGSDGAVAAALVTGKRGLISDAATDALRGAGIYHVVSISGLHMVLAAAVFLWSLRAFLALFPAIALHYPIKKWAAGFAIFGVIAYDAFSGSEIATERSMVMTLVMLFAILVERPVLSLRNLAIAALLLMAAEPESLMGPSFQMSFAAVAAMIAAFERRPGTKDDTTDKDHFTWGGRAKTIAVAMIVSTLVASLATDPFASFHFHRINPYGLIGNTLTIPLVEFVVMPAAVFGVIAEPFGLDGPIWTVMGWGISFMMRVAEWVASLQGSVLVMQAFGVGALLTITFGMLWLIIFTTALRYVGVAIIALGLALTQHVPRADLMVDANGRMLGVRGADGRLSVLNARANPFGVQQWLTAAADAREPGDATLAGDGRCDKNGCVTRLPDGRAIALVLEPQALAEDCSRAFVVVTRLRATHMCKGPQLVLDAAHFDTFGATQIRLSEEGVEILRTDRDAQVDRPWSRAKLVQNAVPLNIAPPAKRIIAPDDVEEAEPVSNGE